MKSKAHSEAFSRTLAGALLDFKAAVEKRDKAGANLEYAFALGLIGGATLSGAIGKEEGAALQAKLEETRQALMDAFGDAPKSKTWKACN
ncbi:hypothetical protein AAAC13_01355 [Pseudomonas aeruginosa]|uniref:hypothetical protein n=1 Tax=Pseudomonas aeruginosa group TaxID=136841 RepID=UPI0005B4F917|nr:MULTISPECIES: hypothetical protein [Pseudomonas aeruginosa group]EIU1445458.1 hypothetical protein [Pseudomonas aeruginosa]EKV2975684.1 hypothetical protein [Pseudomonas aeruginosa]EKV3160339.1 hypothetical protein [Pseudomonas aeruginosa]EKW6212553.1 hypothetical protein [Pseudomonas aeruginosa]EKW7604453.1 hypothetical protein [Pseudomonas aeruginosa]